MLAGTASTPSTTAACPTCTCGTSRPRGPDRSTSQSTWHEGGDQATAGIQCNTWLMMSQHRLRVQRGYMRGALCEWGGIEHRVPLADSADLIDAPMLPARVIKSHAHTHAHTYTYTHMGGKVPCRNAAQRRCDQITLRHKPAHPNTQRARRKSTVALSLLLAAWIASRDYATSLALK